MTLVFPTLFAALREVVSVSRAPDWGYCPHCERTTRWQTHALFRETRCTCCGRSPLDGSLDHTPDWTHDPS